MKITSFTREQIRDGLDRAKECRKEQESPVRILFAPQEITDRNFDEVCDTYSRVGHDDFDTVVVIESLPGSADKKLPMPSFKSITTPLGEVMANDRLRNDFCDEDDDFFIEDAAYDDQNSLHSQLMLLQCALDDFTVLSLQITDEGSFTVKELAYAVEEILASKNALIVICCDMDHSRTEELNRVLNTMESENLSGLMNYLNSGESNVKGLGSFIAGLIIAKKWGLKLQFDHLINENSTHQNLLTGYGEMQRQPIFG